MKITNNIVRISLLFLGTVAITFSGLNWHVGIMAWIAPIFLLLYTRNIKWMGVLLFFAAMAIAGAISQTCNNLLHLPEVNIFNGIAFGILTTIPYVIDKLLFRSSKFFYTLIFPSSVAFIEFLASLAIGTWGSIAHTQYGFAMLLQISSVIGIYGIWFLVSWFASIAVWIIENKGNWSLVNKGLIVFGSVCITIIVFGLFRLNIKKDDTSKVKVAAIVSETNLDRIMSTFTDLAQGKEKNIPSHIYSDSLTIQTQIKRTLKASKQGAKIVVWNELALILSQQQKQHLLSDMKAICKDNNLYVLASFIEECAEKDKKPFNNVAVLISSRGKVEWEYKKSFLQPTAEAPIINGGDYNLPVIATGYGNIGSVICSDLDFQGYMKQCGKKSVDILLVPAYDWPEITPLHSQMAAIQAIQFGCNIVRSNGKGISAFYNYKGKQLASLYNFGSEENILISELSIQSAQTVYSKIGDVFIGLCFIFILLTVVLRLAETKKAGYVLSLKST